MGEINFPLLQTKRVVVVGVGQVGSKIAAELARAGIGYLRFIDHDILERSNLFRHVLPGEYADGTWNKADGLPTSQGAFASSLHQTLGQHVIVAQPFSVERVIAHWPWELPSGALGIRPIPANVLRHRLPNHEIARINNRRLTRAERADYEAQNVIAPVKRGAGIKFFTAVTTNNTPLTAYATERLEEKIKMVLGRRNCNWRT